MFNLFPDTNPLNIRIYINKFNQEMIVAKRLIFKF